MGLSIEPVSRGELPESAIRGLLFDVLHPANDRGPGGERREKLNDFRHESLRSNADGAAFIAKRGEEVVGFIGVDKSESGDHATISQLWTSMSSGKQQRLVARQLLGAAKDALQARYPHIVAQVESLGRTLSGADESMKRYVHTEAPAEGEQAPIAANDNVKSPESANDDEPLEGMKEAA